jgi:hypothetical protein
MRIGILIGLLLLVLALLFGGCAGTVESGPAESATFEQLPDVSNGKADGQAVTTEKRTILLRMKARLPEQRRLKEALNIGETVDGYVGVPPEGSTPADGTAKAGAIQQFIDDENADRAAYYEIIVRGHARDIRQGLEASREAIRTQVAKELCEQLPPSIPCEEIAASTIDAALEVAFESAVDVTLDPIREEIEQVHGRFWQDRTTRSGEWIEVSNDVWQHKAERTAE